MTTFNPYSWKVSGEALEDAASDMYRQAHDVITAHALKIRGSSAIDAAVLAGDALCNAPWHRLIAAAQEGLTSTASKMVATGEDYNSYEQSAASARFWE